MQKSKMNKTGLRIDSKNNRAYWNGEYVRLSPCEFKVLEILYMFQGRCVSHDDLMDYLYHDNEDAEEPFAYVLKVFVGNIRRKVPGITLGLIFLQGYILCETTQALEVFSIKKFDKAKEKDIIRLLSDTKLSQSEIADKVGVRLHQVNRINLFFKIRKQNFYQFSHEELRMLSGMTTKERRRYGDKVGVSLSNICKKIAVYRKKPRDSTKRESRGS